LKVLGNPDDSIALQRVINTPARGIGKTTMEIIENIALETGTSMWGAIGEVLKRRLLPLRTLSSLKSFKELMTTLEPCTWEGFASESRKRRWQRGASRVCRRRRRRFAAQY